MKLLLDTHVAIWSVAESDQLRPDIRALIEDDANEAYVSAVSIWEIGIKFALGRRDAPPFSARDAIRHFEAAGYQLLDITPDLTAAAPELPLLHGGPFDRLIVAQALAFPLRLITHEAVVARYDNSIILG